HPPPPTPPFPYTTLFRSLSPRDTPPVSTAAPKPAMIPHPIRPAASGRAAGSIFTAWPAATNVSSANAPIPNAGDRGVPSINVIRSEEHTSELQSRGHLVC